LQALTDSSDLISNAGAMRARLDEDSYLFFPGLVDRDRVTSMRRDMSATLERCGWLADGSDPTDAIPGPGARHEDVTSDREYFVAYEAIQRLQSFHELAHDDAIVGVLTTLLGGEVLVHPRKVARMALPELQLMTPPHQDYRLIQGTGDVITCWLPIGDCQDDLGGLAVLRGSHRRGPLPLHESPAVTHLTVDIPFDASSADWAGGPMNAGDVLMFHSLSVHAAKPNRTNRLRLSADYRYQLASDPIVRSSLQPHFRPLIPSFKVLTQGWTSTASVDAHPGANIVGPFDLMRPDIPAPHSRLVSVAAV
jgi:ectoine hydroxylase-related dioxygenase (phytanoyl-CoA dioxygenase family)